MQKTVSGWLIFLVMFHLEFGDEEFIIKDDLQ